MMHTTTHTPRGFTLLIAVVLSSVILAVGISLLDIAFKQIVLASSAKQSQYAFYAADSGMECALYWDQQQAAFDYTTPLSSVTCNAQSIALTSSVAGSQRTTTFSIPCGTGISANITVYKTSTGATTLYSNGYSSCSSTDVQRIERGLKVTY